MMLYRNIATTHHEQNDFTAHMTPLQLEAFQHAIEVMHRMKLQGRAERVGQLKMYGKIIGQAISGHLPQQGKLSIPEPKSTQSITLNDLIKNFTEYKRKKGEWKAATIDGNTQMLHFIKDFLEWAIGATNPMIHQFETDHAFGFSKSIHWDDLLMEPRVVILAEAGAGKTLRFNGLQGNCDPLESTLSSCG